MIKAYILIEMMAGHSRDLVRVLIERNLVTEVDRIHTLPGVVRTNTCVSLE